MDAQHGVRTRLSALVAMTMLVVGLPALTAPSAMAAPQTVTITATGFVPRDVTVLVGETVTFTNSDSVAHQVEFKGAGVACPANPFVLDRNATGACTFTAAGNFAYSDPNKKGNTFRGTVTVTSTTTTPPGQAAAVTLEASRPLVVYGTKVSLTGKVTPVKGAVTVELLARPYPEPAFTKVATTTTQGDGSYSFSRPPQLRTEYRVQFVDGAAKAESPVVTVLVRPKVTLAVKSVSGGKAKLRTGVVSTVSYAGKPVLVQRRNNQGGWTTIRTVRLGQFSSATFAVRVPSGTTRWRVYLQASQAGGGYEPSFSPTRRVVR
jgi:plastocyanin